MRSRPCSRRLNGTKSRARCCETRCADCRQMRTSRAQSPTNSTPFVHCVRMARTIRSGGPAIPNSSIGCTARGPAAPSVARSWTWACAGKPELAAEFAYRDACWTQTRNGGLGDRRDDGAQWLSRQPGGASERHDQTRGFRLPGSAHERTGSTACRCVCDASMPSTHSGAKRVER